MNLVVAQLQDINMFLAKAEERVDIFLLDNMPLPERPPFKGIFDNLGNIMGGVPFPLPVPPERWFSLIRCSQS